MFRRPEDRVRAVRSPQEAAVIRRALEDPLVHALPGARLMELRGRAALGGEFTMVGPDRAPTGLLWNGVNLAPLAKDPEVLDTLAVHALGSRRRASSIVGDRRAVERMWQTLAPEWGSSVRESRWSQPLLVASSAHAPPTLWEGELGVRPATQDEERETYHVAVAMFREEVGTDPTIHDGGRSYAARVRSLIRLGRTYVAVHGGRICFKADVGAIFGPVAQIHGVYVPDDLRGMGIARRGMRELVDLVRRDHAPQVSLYVNSFNTPARRAYAAAGFEEAGELSTILF